MMKRIITLLLGATALVCGAVAIGAVDTTCEPSFSREAWVRVYQTQTAWRPLGTALWGYLAEHLAPPESLGQLCESPYMPIACADLINPYTGVPIQEKQNSPGDVWFEKTPALKVHISVIDPVTGNLVTLPIDFQFNLDVFKLQAQGGRVDLTPSGLKLQAQGGRPEATLAGRLRRLSDPEKTALMVGYYLDGAIWHYINSPSSIQMGARSLPAPPSLEALYARADELNAKCPLPRYGAHLYPPLINKLRNAFTGRPARSVSAPSPGDFRYYFPTPEKACLEVFGKDGQVLWKYFCYPATPAIPSSSPPQIYKKE